jgi:hypothetical protein
MDLITIENKLKNNKIVIADFSGEMIEYQTEVSIINTCRTDLEKSLKDKLFKSIGCSDDVDKIYSDLMNIYNSKGLVAFNNLKKDIIMKDLLDIFEVYKFFLKDADFRFDYFSTSRKLHEALGGSYFIIHNEDFPKRNIFGADYINLSLLTNSVQIKEMIGNPNIVVCLSGDKLLTQCAYNLLSDNGILIGPVGIVKQNDGDLVAGSLANSLILKTPNGNYLGHLD